jgi:radical SAM protein with 4Fe4S-binding SPASM domain
MLPSAKLNNLSLGQCVPVSVTIELTRRCPLSCLHCYLPETRGRALPARELTTAQWKRVLAQLAEAGALYLVFTGGEPLLRRDLADICAHAKKLNFDVRVFSTGLGLTRARALCLKKAGVSAFEISFYGRPPVHDGITGVKGSFARSLKAARLLEKAGIKVKVKTPLMKINLAQAGWLRSMAKREGFAIAFDPLVTAANDGNVFALKLRLSGPRLSEAVKLLGAAPTPVPAPLSFSPHFSSVDFLCGAGRNVCALDPAGNLYPCLQLPVKLGNLAGRRFRDIWENAPWLKKWRSAGPADVPACARCRYADFCSRCPGISLIEKGSVFAPNEPACEMAKITYRFAGRKPQVNPGKKEVSRRPGRPRS